MSIREKMKTLITQLETEDMEFLNALDLEFMKWKQQKNIKILIEENLCR